MDVIGCKWVFKTKIKDDGTLERLKARLVAKVFHQIDGVNYTETFSLVIKPCTIWIMLSLTLVHNWDICQLDVKNAFLHGAVQYTEKDSLPLTEGVFKKAFKENYNDKLKSKTKLIVEQSPILSPIFGVSLRLKLCGPICIVFITKTTALGNSNWNWKLTITLKLQPEFEPVRANLLNRNLVPFLDICLGELLREEQRLSTQMGMTSEKVFSEAVNVAYTAQGRGRNKLQCFNCKEFGHIARNCPKKVCNYCKKEGHLIKDCCVRPQNRQSQAFQADVQSSSSSAPSTVSSDSSHTCHGSTDDCVCFYGFGPTRIRCRGR
ncbi:uncharacterized protein LOC121244162 [Juglans microcarpa x Juglans regia]|uniref:uncharacterized protein LOC121244162 n=1 Tax=Juglans microcarpa x Juglans regia TaxID=2249226 RepID=UPI001B7EA6F2|nr:uncharacterized protein LOC121244162 [Juglans microcarpa x Juglans regia]